MGKQKVRRDSEGVGETLSLNAVLLEWGGQKPPTTWYRRLYQIAGIKVRDAGKDVDAGELSLLMQRAGQHNGAVVQEGAILCASYSLARTLRALAVAGLEVAKADGTVETIRPQAAFLGKIEIEKSQVNEQDLLVLARMSAVFSKRGKKGEPQQFAITCYEEMATHNHEGHSAVNCPVCGGVQVRVRQGYAIKLADPVQDDVLSAWLRLRFGQGGVWEKPEIVADGVEPLADAMQSIVGMTEKTEQVFVMGLAGSLLMRQIETVTSNRDMAMELLDAVFIARNYWSAERRLNARLQAVTQYFQMGNTDVTGISLAELPQPDLFDCAPLLGAERAAALMTTYVSRVKAAASAHAPMFAPALPAAA